MLTVERVLRDVVMGPEAVKLVFFFHRRVGLSPEVFRRHWYEVHGPLVMEYIGDPASLHPEPRRGVRVRERRPPDFDGLVEA